jgi:hypothetical protein
LPERNALPKKPQPLLKIIIEAYYSFPRGMAAGVRTYSAASAEIFCCFLEKSALHLRC